MKTSRAIAIAVLTAAPCWVGAQDNALEPKEWTVPWEKTRPRDPIMDASGRVWFVGQTGNYVAYLDSKSGQFKRYQIEDGTFPHNINVDERGGVWFTGNRNGKLYSIDPASGQLKSITLEADVKDPHTMIWDKNGVAWFTAQQSNYIGRLDRATGAVRLWKTGDNTRPYGIVIDSKGQPWFDLFGTNKVGTVDPKTMELKEFAVPNDRARPRRIALTSDDAVWYGDYSRGFLGRVDPKSGAVEEWALPSGGQSMPYAMTSDDRDRVWLAETGVQPNRLVAFDAKSKSWVATIPIPSNGASANTIRHMTFDRASRQIWFGTDAGTIGAVKVPAEIRKLTP